MYRQNELKVHDYKTGILLKIAISIVA